MSRVLCSIVPIGIISVFSRLKRAPDALHHSFRIASKSMYLSELARYTVVSSAYRLTFTV